MLGIKNYNEEVSINVYFTNQAVIEKAANFVANWDDKSKSLWVRDRSENRFTVSIVCMNPIYDCCFRFQCKPTRKQIRECWDEYWEGRYAE